MNKTIYRKLFFRNTKTRSVGRSSHSLSKDSLTKNPLLKSWLMTAVLCLPFQFANANQVVHILPLGDSITHAEINRASYRYFLWKKLIDADVKFDFVGSMNTQLDTYSKGDTPQPDYQQQSFDKDHEGHFAWEVNHIWGGRDPNNNTGSGSLGEWMQSYDFDIALLHLGTNDAFMGQDNNQTVFEIKAIIEKLREDNPNVVTLLAKVIPTAKGEREAVAVEQLAELIPAVADEMNTAESPVILVDMFENFDVNELTYDGVHPNEKGEMEMAQRWFNAIMDALPLVK